MILFGVSETLILNRNIQYVVQVETSMKIQNFRDKIALSGITVLAIGVALLIFTFASAYGFLTEVMQILSTQDIMQAFGDALAPLIATSIRIMYLGVMGWIASLITIRGVTIIANTPKPATGEDWKTTESQQKPQSQPQKPKEKVEEKAKPEAKPAEPELIVIPLEEMEQQQETRPSK